MKKKPVNRNPIARQLSDPKFRQKVAKSGIEKADQKDSWSKNAKHKKPTTLEEFYQVGDKLEITNPELKKALKITKDTEATVADPNGPSNTLGVTIDGEYHLIDEEDVELIFEAMEYVELTEWSYAETTSGIRIPISSEENEILAKCQSKIYKTDLSEREQEVARKMVSRGVINRHKDDAGKLYFIHNKQKLNRL